MYIVSWMMIWGFEGSFWWYHRFIDSLDLTQIKAAVKYTKEKHLYMILVPSAYILLSFCIRIGAFDRFHVFGLMQVFRVSCTIVIRVRVQRENMDHCG